MKQLLLALALVLTVSACQMPTSGIESEMKGTNRDDSDDIAEQRFETKVDSVFSKCGVCEDKGRSDDDSDD